VIYAATSLVVSIANRALESLEDDEDRKQLRDQIEAAEVLRGQALGARSARGIRGTDSRPSPFGQ